MEKASYLRMMLCGRFIHQNDHYGLCLRMCVNMLRYQQYWPHIRAIPAAQTSHTNDTEHFLPQWLQTPERIILMLYGKSCSHSHWSHDRASLYQNIQVGVNIQFKI